MHDETSGITEENQLKVSCHFLVLNKRILQFYRILVYLLKHLIRHFMWRIVLSLAIQINFASAQCDCESINLPSQYVKVTTVAELQDALQQANAMNGNLNIVLAKGNYQLSTNLLYISPNMKNLKIVGETGNSNDVILRGKGMNGNVTHIFNIAASHVTIANMTIGWVFYHPIQIHGESNADSCIIHNVKIIDGNEQFIKISGSANETNGSDGGIISCCHFEFSAGVGNQYYTGGIDGHHCVNWIVRNNIFKHIRSPETNLAEHAIHFWSNSKNIITENNHIINCDRGIGYGLGDDPARGNFGGIIRNNIIHTSRDVGIGIEYSPDVKIYNNTVWTDNYFNSIEYRFSNTTNTHIANNLSNKRIINRDNAHAVLENNYIAAEKSMFTDPANNNFHLSGMDTRIIGKGKFLHEVTTDFDCEVRSVNFDIGADQLSTTTWTSYNESKDQVIQINTTPEYYQINIPHYGKKGFTIRLVDVMGRTCFQARSQESKIDLKRNALSTGIYFLIITHPSRIFKAYKLAFE